MQAPIPDEQAAPSRSAGSNPQQLEHTTLTGRIDAILPQTQCTRCGYPDCHAYAEAIADGLANINQCPPGGAEGIARIASITGDRAVALNPQHGTEGPRRLAVIDEAWCIGCTLCIQACPVDAIAGAPKRMHTVLSEWCTGCELCLPPCPTDCIALLPLPDASLQGKTGWAAWSAEQAQEARQRYAARQTRQRRREQARRDRLHDKTPQHAWSLQAAPETQVAPQAARQERKQAMVNAALERARQRQAERKR